jgi:imidazolonepropionase-like amidohydrolase
MKTLRKLCSTLPLLLGAAAQESLAIKAGKVLTLAGEDLENVVILIESGRIKAIGKDVEVPWNAKVVDAAKQVVMPAWVLAHSSGGLYGGGTEVMQNVPFLNVADGIDPSAEFFEEALRNGVGTIHVLPTHRTLIGGVGMVVKPHGTTVADMAMKTRTALKLSLWSQGGGRVAQIQKLRRALDDVRDYLQDFERRKKEFEQEKAAGAVPADRTWDEEYDKQKKPVIDLLQGKLGAHLFVPGAAELPEALRLVAGSSFPSVLVLGARCHKGALALTRLNKPVVLDAQMEIRETDPETERETLVCPAAVLHKAGVPFALSIEDSRGASGAARYPWWQIATAIRHGIDRKTAIAAMTTVPAALLGLDQELGTVAEGKRAHLQILTGDPLQATTWVDKVVLDGEVVYERSKDNKLKLLLGDAQPQTRPETRPSAGN